MRSDLAYSALKAAWHTDKIRAMRLGQQVAPSQVQLILSDLCNQDCHFYAYRMSGGFSTEQFSEKRNGQIIRNPNRKIATDKAEEILRDCQEIGVCAIQFTGGGEPTVHPDHLSLFRLANALGMESSLVTNGVILRPGWEDVYRAMSWIRISVDAGDAETYSRVRRVPNSMHAKVLGNIRQMVEVTRATDCLLGVGYVVTRENWHGLRAACESFARMGVPYIRLAAMFSEQGSSYYNGVYDEIREEIRRAEDEFSGQIQVVNLFGDRISDLEQGRPDYGFCGYQQFNMYIGANLKIYRCCTTSYTRHGEVGDLSGQRLADWFRSSEKAKAYREFDARSCGVCQFNDKNRVINYMVSKDPVHVNYV